MNLPDTVQAMNVAPSGFDAARDLPKGFVDFFRPLDRAFTSCQRDLAQKRAAALAAAHQGMFDLEDSVANTWSHLSQGVANAS